MFYKDTTPKNRPKPTVRRSLIPTAKWTVFSQDRKVGSMMFWIWALYWGGVLLFVCSGFLVLLLLLFVCLFRVFLFFISIYFFCFCFWVFFCFCFAFTLVTFYITFLTQGKDFKARKWWVIVRGQSQNIYINYKQSLNIDWAKESSGAGIRWTKNNFQWMIITDTMVVIAELWLQFLTVVEECLRPILTSPKALNVKVMGYIKSNRMKL